MEYFLGPLKKYAVFGGRASRKEYWMFVLMNIIAYVILMVIDNIISDGFGILSWIYSLAVLVPSLAVAVRRLHDTNRSGGWIFISLVPIVGPIVLIVFLAQAGQVDKNQFGPKPLQ
ncbi:MAG: hypothetical protein A3F54_00050 [Candidatus Kerfeldbacteria bacterium RIFCSPHIGHO2_12_FULL_48_17]|uniref:DUF805 domain-containing protein n=1 Tax=Candidatus Kerfeldbacteria bacterium RIFCSPHIGHO2_12_FULL_48_17 TaxID=1798542 RepID=A0A1G2B971_9BACT|nr:MAG: hypothetical protein A3F54_00050 [Candidatus Kerfeldbacteria bacterium RIFCSPHIGHO2_12_FULL_48_17]